MNRTALALLSCFAVGACATTRSGDDDDDSSGEEDCASGYDEDDDQLVDCFDPDCASVPACIQTEICTNVVDDDGDSLADCADPGCLGDPACAADPESNCTDELDDDEDGDIDCADSDCVESPACEEQTPSGDCEELCAHRQDCGVADPNCLDACECSVDRMFAPEFASSFYACTVASSCSIYEDSTPCLNQADLSSSDLAEEMTTTCASRQDCEGLPCEFFGMFNDDVLETFSTCLQRSDCLNCFEDAATTCPEM